MLADLVMNGLVYSTGRGDDALYGLSSESDRHVIAPERDTRVVTRRATPVSNRAVRKWLASDSLQAPEARAARIGDHGRAPCDVDLG